MLSTVDCVLFNFLLLSILLMNFYSSFKSLFLLTIFAYKKSCKHVPSLTIRKPNQLFPIIFPIFYFLESALPLSNPDKAAEKDYSLSSF